jgi:hypothetical protein
MHLPLPSKNPEGVQQVQPLYKFGVDFLFIFLPRDFIPGYF